MIRILFFAAFLFVNPTWAQQIHFSGSISGLADENISVEYPIDQFGLTWIEEIPVVNNGFSKKVELPTSGWLKLTYKDKDQKVFVWKASDSLHVSFEADFLDEHIQVSGESGRINTFAKQVSQKFGSRLLVRWLEEQAADATNLDAMEMDAFRMRTDIVHALEKAEQPLPEEFVLSFKNHITYYYYLSLFEFSAVKTANSSIPKATEIPKVLLEGLDWERMNRASELDSEFFRELLLEFVQYKAFEEFDFMKFSDKNAEIQEAYNVARANLNGESLRYFLTATLLRNADVVKPSLLRQMHFYLKEQESAQTFVSIVEKQISERLNAKEEEATIAVEEEEVSEQYNIQLTDLNGKEFNLASLKGKVLYVDIWASWCGPCRKQFPFAKELKSKLTKKEKKNIVFLYVSIDNTETVWKKAVKELEIEGMHGLSKGGWGSEVTAKFGVRSIPRYFIFDKKGRVVESNAPRPSDPNLLPLLRKLATQ